MPHATTGPRADQLAPSRTVPQADTTVSWLLALAVVETLRVRDALRLTDQTKRSSSRGDLARAGPEFTRTIWRPRYPVEEASKDVPNGHGRTSPGGYTAPAQVVSQPNEFIQGSCTRR